MNKRLLIPCLLALAACPPGAWANAFFSRAPGFTVPDGTISYLGNYYSGLKIMQTGNMAAIPFGFGGQNPTAFQAVLGAQSALFKTADRLKLDIQARPAPAQDQQAVLVHSLAGFKTGEVPFDRDRLWVVSGGMPYALVGLIDYYGTFWSPVQIRAVEEGQFINYWGKRSILEQDGFPTALIVPHLVGAFELFLVSTRDGRLLWQANAVVSVQPSQNSTLQDAADKAFGKMLGDLFGRN